MSWSSASPRCSSTSPARSSLADAAAAAPRLCRRASRRRVDHRLRLEPGTVAGQALPDRRRPRRRGRRPAGRAGAGRRPCDRRQQRSAEGGRRDRGDRDPAGGRSNASERQPTACSSITPRSLIDQAIPAPTAARDDEALAKAQEILLGFGVTARRRDEHVRRRLERVPPRRRSGAAEGPPDDLLLGATDSGGAAKPDAVAVRRSFAAGRHQALRRRRARLARGVARSSLMPTSPTPAGCSSIRTPRSARSPIPRAARGFQVATHAIGDAANAQIISASTSSCRRNIGRDRRWRIEHFQIADPADIPRLAPAGIIASMQPTHQTSDRLMAEARLGPNRLAGAYAWQIRTEEPARDWLSGPTSRSKSPNPFPGLAAGDQPAGHERPAAGRLDPERSG